MSDNEDRWFDYPEKIVEPSNIGDYHVQLFLDNYVGSRLDQNMELFDRAFALLTERGHYSRKNAFGEMHCDSYLWIEKCEHSQVLVWEQQSSRTLFIKELQYDKTYGEEACAAMGIEDKPMYGHFHIRELYYQYAYPTYKRAQLKESSLKYWRERDFKPQYNDCRDVGYVGTASHYSLRDYETTIKDATMRTATIIDYMRFWEIYLDDPEELE